jgi:NAD(P)-dependent dehydrogenase (short-subunit alcohol dehydrogenase family)
MATNKKIALITGVSREAGIGFGLAQKMAALDYQVIITARAVHQAEELAKKLTTPANSIIAEALDITNDESVKHVSEVIQARYGRLDILINNAGGILDYGIPTLQTDFEVTRQAFETNLFGAWRVIKYMHPLLKESSQPRIVNISSGAGSFTHPVFGLPNHPAILTSYGLSKLALNGLTVKLAKELAKDNILINAVNPGFVATAPGMEAMGARSVADSLDGIIWAASLPDNGPTGKFFEDKQELTW